MSGGDTGALKREACQAIDAAADELIAFGEDIFRHPELGFKEERTGQKVAGAFAALGLQCLARPGRTGVKGWLPAGRPGPRIAILGELDAVISPQHPFADPATGAAHACGHHAQLAAMLGAAAGLRRSWPEPSAFWRRRPRNTSRSATAARCGAKESCNTWAASSS